MAFKNQPADRFKKIILGRMDMIRLLKKLTQKRTHLKKKNFIIFFMFIIILVVVD